MLPIAHYFTAENASGLQIVGDYTLVDNAKGCVVLQHGFSSSRALSFGIQTARLAALAAGFHVVQFDTTHSFGASEGALEHCTAHTAYADLCAVMAWAKTQPFAPKQFVLCGTSLGGLCVGHYAEENPADICGLILLSPIILGSLFVSNYRTNRPDDYLIHQNTGFITKTHPYNSKVIGRVSWAFSQSTLDFDLAANAYKITCPTLLTVGSADTTTPVPHAQTMAQALGEKAQLYIIDNAPHTMVDMAHLQQLHDITQKWLSAICT